jgi:hypothetical protein
MRETVSQCSHGSSCRSLRPYQCRRFMHFGLNALNHVSTELVVLPSRASISCSRSNLDVCFDQELIVEIKRSLKALCGPLPFSCEKTCTVLLRPVFLRVHALTIASIDNGYLLCAVTW